MKKFISILLLIICMLLQIQSIAQVKKPKATPATSQMPDMEKMLKELPADQQAMARQMIGNVTAKPAEIKKGSPAPPPPSPIIEIKLVKPLKAPTEAEAKDRLLWYKGKKINDSMLITTQAMVVLYSSPRNMVIAQPLEETDPFREMVKNVSKEQKMIDDYVETEAAKPNGWMNYPIIQATVDQMAIANKQFNNAIKNTVALPESPNNRPATGKDKGVPPGKPSTGGSKNCDEVSEKTKSVLQQQHEALKALLNNPPDVSLDAPPKERFDQAFFCDSNAQKKYFQDVNNWKTNVVAYEMSLINKAKALEVTIQVNCSGHDCADKISPGLSADIDKSMKLGWSRLEEKITKLANSYGKDVFRQLQVVSLAVEIRRQGQLMGIANAEKGVIADIPKILDGPEFENYINEQMEKKNWGVLFNMLNIVVRLNTLTLLGGNEDVAMKYGKLFVKIPLWNRFAITVDIDFNERYHDDDGEDALKVNGSIKTMDKYYVSLIPASCSWYICVQGINLSASPDDQSHAPYIPMQVVGGLKSIKDDKKWINYPYSGPKDMRMYFPYIRLDFTNTDKPDTVVLQILRYVADIPPMPVTDAFTTDLTGYLNDVYMQPAQTAANEEKVKEFVKDVGDKFSAIITTSNNTTALEKLKFEHSMMMQKKETTKGFSDLIYTAYTAIPFNAQHGSSTLIDVNIDTKHKNDNVEVVYGIFKLKVVHEPDSAIKLLEQLK